MSVLYGSCGALQTGYGIDYYLSAREPLLWDQRIVTLEDANGNPLETEFYYAEDVVFTVKQTWNSQNKETSYMVYLP